MFHLCTAYLSSTLILLAGTFLLLIKVPPKEEWYYFKISRIFIFITYTILSVAGSATILYEYDNGMILDRRPIILMVSFFQAMLFSFTAIAFVQPRYLSRKRIWLHVGAILPFALLSPVAKLVTGETHLPSLTFSAAAYAGLLGLYTFLFLKEYRKGVNQLEEQEDREYNFRLKWIKRFFFASLSVGVIALAFSIFNLGTGFFDAFTILYCLFYLYVINRFNYYLKSCGYIVNILTSPEMDAMCQTKVPVQKMVPQIDKTGEAIQKWVDDEQYLVSEMSIDEIADSLLLTHDELNEWCSAHYQVLFRTWRMQLRIQKAQELLVSQPELRISELQVICGFSDKSHFLRQFKNITGMTPSEYRKKSLL